MKAGLAVLALVVALCAAAATASDSTATSSRPTSILIPLGPPFLFEAGISPQVLSEKEREPIEVSLGGQQNAVAHGTLREVVLDIPADGNIRPRSTSWCPRARIEALGTNEARRACREAIVGRGRAQVALSETGVPHETVRLTVFNSGVKDGVARLLIHGEAGSEVVLTAVKVSMIHREGFSAEAVVAIPPFAGGDGQLLDFQLSFDRSAAYAVARCRRGGFAPRLEMKTIQKEIWKTVMLIPCKPLS